MRTRLLYVPIFFTLLGMSGCSTFKTPDRTVTEIPKAFEPVACNSAIDQACAVGTYQKALAACLASSQFFQSEADRATRNSMGVGLLGTLAGSVLSIGAVGNAAKAWAGLSGAGNAYQSQLDSSSMGAATYKTNKDNIDRNVRALQKKVESSFVGKKWDEIYAASVGTGAACANGISTE